MGNDDRLQTEAQDFARRISRLVSEFTGTECPFVATKDDNRLVVRPESERGISLLVKQEPLLTLLVDYYCEWDSDERYLRVEESSVKVYPLGAINKEPLFRYEYHRQPQGHVPCAHLQIHAHSDAFTHLLGWPGRHSRRARDRKDRGLSRFPTVSEFHFPLGGPRFRPALEDILEVLQEEFGLKTGENWLEVCRKSRTRWRRIQLAAAVRDSPETAAEELRRLGYEVTGDAVPERLNKLTML